MGAGPSSSIGDGAVAQRLRDLVDGADLASAASPQCSAVARGVSAYASHSQRARKYVPIDKYCGARIHSVLPQQVEPCRRLTCGARAEIEQQHGETGQMATR
jgi:hypothetical protein